MYIINILKLLVITKDSTLPRCGNLTKIALIQIIKNYENVT
jgi:hypothetical protein